jgi:hypothetical protein
MSVSLGIPNLISSFICVSVLCFHRISFLPDHFSVSNTCGNFLLYRTLMMCQVLVFFLHRSLTFFCSANNLSRLRLCLNCEEEVVDKFRDYVWMGSYDVCCQKAETLKD